MSQPEPYFICTGCKQYVKVSESEAHYTEKPTHTKGLLTLAPVQGGSGPATSASPVAPAGPQGMVGGVQLQAPPAYPMRQPQQGQQQQFYEPQLSMEQKAQNYDLIMAGFQYPYGALPPYPNTRRLAWYKQIKQMIYLDRTGFVYWSFIVAFGTIAVLTRL